MTLSAGIFEIMTGGTAGSGTIGFTSAGGYLRLDDAPAFSGRISGFGVPGSVDLVNVAFSAATLGYSGTILSGVLTVSDGTHVATLNMIGNYTLANFHKADDGAGGTLITDPPVSSATGHRGAAVGHRLNLMAKFDSMERGAPKL